MPKHEVTLPNVRKLFIPDPGFVIFDVDLAGADAQVVAWEAEDDDLKNAFRAGLDVHSHNAEAMWGSAFTSLPGTKDDGPKSRKRKECKQGVHLTNYGGTARTAAMVLGWTVHEADQFQKRWFSIHPGIKKNFQGKIEAAIKSTRTVTNKFGYRRVYFGRIEDCYTEALAWVPQSTVAETSFRGALKLEDELGDIVQMLLQVHDSLVFQVPKCHAHKIKEIKEALAVPIPYSDPLTIQWGIAKSEKSWGDCESVKLEAA